MSLVTTFPVFTVTPRQICRGLPDHHFRYNHLHTNKPSAIGSQPVSSTPSHQHFNREFATTWRKTDSAIMNIIEAVFGRYKSPAERMREHQRSLQKATRELDRERTKLESQENSS
ncbi:hypothetical protein H4Q26_006795 [Puccinia striiformis f. sp. tritici PST-130]|nr:hypothetical protein H4Q26_006795 [Puccinia striiformis f. sp. tritici PST-130]